MEEGGSGVSSKKDCIISARCPSVNLPETFV